MTIKYIVYNYAKGVFLGAMLGEAFWSNDGGSSISPYANVFTSKIDFDEYTRANEVEITDYMLIPVDVNDNVGTGFISSDELRRQGKPYWNVLPK